MREGVSKGHSLFRAAMPWPPSWAWSRPTWAPPPFPMEGHRLGPPGAVPGPAWGRRYRDKTGSRRSASWPSWPALLASNSPLALIQFPPAGWSKAPLLPMFCPPLAKFPAQISAAVNAALSEYPRPPVRKVPVRLRPRLAVGKNSLCLSRARTGHSIQRRPAHARAALACVILTPHAYDNRLPKALQGLYPWFSAPCSKSYIYLQARIKDAPVQLFGGVFSDTAR